MLVRVGAPPLDLKPDTTIVIGRAQEADLSVPSNRVSRRHAELYWKDDRVWIKDLGSQNGTQVNGKRIQDHPLEDSDEIAVGPFLCTYRCVSGVGSVGKAAPAADTNALTQPMLADAMAGRLDLVNLFELLQTLEFNQKTGLLEVFGADSSGSVGFREGKPVYAEAEDRTGVDAIYLLLREKEGQFSFGPNFDASHSVDVNAPVTAILMEASRRQDEGQ